MCKMLMGERLGSQACGQGKSWAGLQEGLGCRAASPRPPSQRVGASGVGVAFRVVPGGCCFRELGQAWATQLCPAEAAPKDTWELKAVGHRSSQRRGEHVPHPQRDSGAQLLCGCLKQSSHTCTHIHTHTHSSCVSRHLEHMPCQHLSALLGSRTSFVLGEPTLPPLESRSSGSFWPKPLAPGWAGGPSLASRSILLGLPPSQGGLGCRHVTQVVLKKADAWSQWRRGSFLPLGALDLVGSAGSHGWPLGRRTGSVHRV